MVSGPGRGGAAVLLGFFREVVAVSEGSGHRTVRSDFPGVILFGPVPEEKAKNT